MRSILALSAWVLFFGCNQEAPKSSRTPTAAATPKTDDAKKPATPEKDDKKEAKTPPDPVTGPALPPNPVDTTIPPGPTTTAITVAAGPVSFDLASAKPALTGATLTATLTVNAAAGAVLASTSLTNIAIKAPATTGFVLYRPVLVWVGADGKEQQFPIGVNINEKIPKTRSVPLAGLTAVSFEGVDTGAKIKLRFSALEPIADALLDGIPNYRECKAPQNFQAVATALQPCKGCHNGLFAYDFIDKDMATACGQNLKIIDKTLSGTGTLPAIPSGTHHAVNASAVGTALGPWKTGEGL